MEAVLGQVEQLPALLAVSRSALVRDWDSLTLDRALEWARYFQHLHERFRARPQLREALARRLRRSQPCPLLGFPALGRCPQLLGLALLENRALPPAACRRLLRSLLQPPGAGPGSDPRGLPLLARRKAAACLLAVPRRAPGPEPQLQAEARLLLSRLRQEGQRAGEAAGQLRWLGGVQEGQRAGEAAGQLRWLSGVQEGQRAGEAAGQLRWLSGVQEGQRAGEAAGQLRWLSGVQEGQRAGEAAGQLRWLSGVQEGQRAGEAAGQLRWLSGVQEGQRAGEAAGQLRWLSGVQEGQRAGEAAGQLRWLSGALELLPQPRAFGVVAAALALLKQGPGAEQAGDGDRDGSSSPDGYQESAAGDGCTAGLLLSWLLGSQERFSAFCLCLPSSYLAFLAGHYSQLSRSYLDLLTGWGRHLHYDPLQGRWVKSCLDKAELSWEELRERFICLCQGSTPLKEQTQAALELLRTQDGDFNVRGLSVWADLLMEVGY